MTDIVCDASVVIKWFLSDRGEEAPEARALLAAHRQGQVFALVLDLTFYEVGNVLIRALGRSASDTATVLEALEELCPTVALSAGDRRLAAQIAEECGLSLYDAAYAAIARSRGGRLATADRQLVRAGLGEMPSTLVARLGLDANR